MILRDARSVVAILAWMLAGSVGTPVAGGAVPTQAQSPPDSVALRHAAEESQARFERRRRRLANRTLGGHRGECDVTVGRMCLHLGPGDDWWPEPDPPELLAARDTLLVRLWQVARRIPGDGWVSGQRVAYLAEVHRLDTALEVAEACASLEPGWCAGLRGLVLHLQGRFPDAEKAFRVMLAAQDTATARAWADPSLLLDGPGRDALASVPPRERTRRIRLTWRWADPLFLAPGNDRWTEHMARRVMERIRREAENPYRLPWADDLSEILLRYGWEYGWERVDPVPAMGDASPSMRGQEHPYTRSFMPPGQALTRPEETTPGAWSPSARTGARTGYAPSYAPVFLPADGGLFRFPRGDSLVLVAWLGLPRDTSVHADHHHPPLAGAWRWRGRPPVLGLFAEEQGGPVRGGTPRGTTRTGEDRGTLRLALPPGRFLVSAEVWAPDLARAGRIRQGLTWQTVAPDVATLSDLVLLRPPDDQPAPDGSPDGAGLPANLAEALPHIRVGPVRAGMPLAVAWELDGVGRGAGPVRYQLELRRTGEGFFRRAGRFLGLLGGGPAVELTWTEPAPETPGPAFRSTRLVLPVGLEPGSYRLRLRASLPGRETLERWRELRVVNSPR